MMLEYVANDCVCGFPAGQNPSNCERCKFLKEIVRLRALLEMEEAKVQSMVDHMDDLITEAVANHFALNLEELLQYCRVSNQRPTVEAIEKALGGQSLAHCLHQM